MIGHPLAERSGRASTPARLPWTSPKIVAQMTKWASLAEAGCTNKDVLTKTNILGAFIKGKAAMIVDGNWDTATLQKGLGKNLAPFVPPYSTASSTGVVQYPGDGFSVMKYSKHPKEAVAVPEVHDDAAGREDHLGGRPDPRHQGVQDEQPGRRTRCSTSRRSRAMRRTRCWTT